jgi:hypothetical protein
MIIKLAGEVCDWFPLSITRHNDPTICYYKLRLLTDSGMRKHDLKLSDIIKKAARHKENNLFSVRVFIPEETTGFPKADPHADEWHALHCDSPLVTYILLKLGHNTEAVMRSVEAVAKKWRTPQGWFCHFAFVKNFYKKLQDAEGRFTPTSMFRAYKEWEFADKKRASGWITFLCCRILKRYYG